MLIFLEQKCQEPCQTVEQMSERQELFATLMESKESLQNDALRNFKGESFRSWRIWRNGSQKMHWSCWDRRTGWKH